MSKTKIAAVWFACGLLGVLTCATVSRASWQGLEYYYSGKPCIMKIMFKGMEQLSAADLEPYLNLAHGKCYEADKAAEDCATIVRRYQERGYPFATCSQQMNLLGNWGFTMGEVVYTIEEGPKVKVEHVEFTGNRFVGADVLAEHIESHKRGTSRTNFALVQNDVVRLTEYYRSFGYLDAVVSYELQWNLDGGEAVMMFHIHEGERYKVR